MSHDDDENDASQHPAPLAPSGGFRARARPKLTDDTLARIFQRRADGWTWDAACAEEGVRTESLRRLALRDPAVGAEYERAQALGAKWYADRIAMSLDDGDPARIKAWSGWAWLAERFHPTVFRRPTERVESTLAVKPVEQVDREEAYAELVQRGALRRGANPEVEAEAVRRGLLPADVVDGEIEEGE